MSLFGSLMGDLEDDPFFGHHARTMRQMNQMMNSFFPSPFEDLMGVGDMGMPRLMGPPADTRRPMGRDIMPFGFGFPNMNRLFPNVEQVTNNPNCHSYSSSSVMTMTTGPDGRPQVYQASSSTRSAPGGIKETKKSVSDTRSGTKKLAIGHHIGERAHVLEREHNVHSGEQEERQEFVNLEEEEAGEFNREWEQKTRQTYGALEYGHRHSRRPREQFAALPSTSSSVRSRLRDHMHRSPRPMLALPSHEKTRKRDHEPDDDKRYKTSKHSKPSNETNI